VNVLRNVHRGLRARALLLDVHPVGVDFAVRAGGRGLGFVDARRFARVVAAMDDGVARVLGDGLFTEVRTLRRNVVERYDDADELFEEADDWEHLRLPAVVRRRLRETDARPVELVDEVSYRLLRRGGRR
jgi:hypothetical protein